MPRWVFCYMDNKTFDFSSKKRIFLPKTTKFGPKLAFLVNLGQTMQAYSVPCWWVGWWLWRAGCISQDTYYFIIWYWYYSSFCSQLLTHLRIIFVNPSSPKIIKDSLDCARIQKVDFNVNGFTLKESIKPTSATDFWSTTQKFQIFKKNCHKTG